MALIQCRSYHEGHEEREGVQHEALDPCFVSLRALRGEDRSI
jgi:hypothetical protein